MGSRLRAERAQKLTRVLLVFLALVAFGCEHYEEKIFIRNAPDVDQALANLDSKDAGAATSLLQTYLETGECKDGVIGTGGRVRKLPNAGFDLGLALFKLAERYGEPFDAPAKAAVPQAAPGNPANPGATDPNAEAELARRSQEVECALMVVEAVAADRSVPLALRAESYYLAGNLEFLRGDYESAVKMYDDALRLSPGIEALEPKGSAGAPAALPIGNLAAWNRSIALQRIEETKPPPPNDAGAPPDQDPGDEKKDEDKKDEQKQDEKKDDEQKQDEKKDEPGKDEEKKPEEPKQDEKKDQAGQDQKQEEEKKQPQPADPAAAKEPPPDATRSQDERVLDMLESAPTLQQEAAKRSLGTKKVSGREDR